MSPDLAYPQKAQDKLHSDKSHGATQAQIKKDEQTGQSDPKVLATAANRLFEELGLPVCHLKEIQERASRRDQASIEERAKD